MNSYDFLVIILSVTLFIFLIVGIVAGVYLMKIFKKVNTATEHIANIAENAEKITNLAKNSATNSAIAGFVSGLMQRFTNKKGENSDE